MFSCLWQNPRDKIPTVNQRFKFCGPDCENVFQPVLSKYGFNWKHSWDSKDLKTVPNSTTDWLYENRTSLSLAHPPFPLCYRDNSKQMSQNHSKSAVRCCKRRHSTAQVDRSVRGRERHQCHMYCLSYSLYLFGIRSTHYVQHLP